MSFNRPQFLGPVLASLKKQRDCDIDARRVHLFQDGAVNRYTRIRYATDADIDACVEEFRRQFPRGAIHRSAENIGICENFLRAERYAFEELDCEVAYFMEDDLVLSPHYLTMMNQLCRWAASTSNVAYFAAYGDYYAAPEEIAQRQREVATLDHHWGFGLLRRHWRTMQPLLQPYYDIVCGADYTRRDSRAVFDLYAPLDAAPGVSSQDGVKAFACDRLGLWRANTAVPFARYIGSVGQHMTAERFKAMGFERTVLATEAVSDLQFPLQAEIGAMLARQRGVFAHIRSDYPALVAKLPGPKYSPMRRCEREDVKYAYRLLLNRKAPPEQELRSIVSTKSVHALIAELVRSNEFMVFGAAERRPCTREDVVHAYRLLLHREPELESVFDECVGILDPSRVVHSIWSGEECQQLWASIEPAAQPHAASDLKVPRRSRIRASRR